MSLIRINRDPSPRQLAVFAFAWLGVFAAAAAAAWRRGQPRAGEVWCAVAPVAPALALAGRRPLRALYVGACYATFPIGWAVSQVVLAAAYYLVVTPCGVIARLVGYDPLGRRFDRARQSHWVERPPAPPPESYFKQG